MTATSSAIGSPFRGELARAPSASTSFSVADRTWLSVCFATPWAAVPSSPDSDRSTWSGAATTKPHEAMWVVSDADCSGKPP